jgi:hypothetical protein
MGLPGRVLAAGVTTEDVRRAYFASPAVPPSYWITEMQMDPPQLIVSDDSTSKVYRVPVSIKGGAITFGEATEVEIEYVDTTAAKVAARWASAAASRKDGEPPMAPRPGAAQRILRAQRQIGAAMAAGRIGPDGARRWATRAAQGQNIDLIEQLGSVPSLAEQNKLIMAHSNQAVLDILTKALSGDGEHEALPKHTKVYDPDGNEISEAAWAGIFGPENDRAAGHIAAAAAAERQRVADMSDDQLFDELFPRK